MNHLARLLLLPLATCALAVNHLSAADAVEIKQRWPVGKKISQTMKMDQSMAMDVAGQKVDQKTNMTIEMSTGVTKHEDGKQKRLTTKYTRMAMEMAGLQTISYDSAKPGDDPQGIGKAIGGIVDKELKALVNDKEEVTDLENYTEFSAGLAGGVGGQIFAKEQMLEMMKQGMLRSVPGKPVKVGDSWPLENTVKLPMIGAITMKGTYTLKSIGNHDGVPSYEIALDGKVASDGGAAGGAPGIKLENGKATGTIWFDPALGIVRTIDATESMTLTVPNPTQPGATMTIPMNQRVVQTVTKVEDTK